MAIKQHAILSTTEVADGNFRSLTEVERYLSAVRDNLTDLEMLLRQYQSHFARLEKAATQEFVVNRDGKPGDKKSGGPVKFTLDKVSVTNMGALRKNFSVIEELSDQVEMLDSLYNSVAVNFKDTRGSAEVLKNIKAMQKSADAKMQAGLKFLADVGQKKIPKEFEQMVEATVNIIAPSLVFRKNETAIYAYETKDEHLAFSVYVKLYGLEDDEGNQHQEFYIVFTCVLKPVSGESDKVSANYYVTAMSDFAPPGKYLLGKSIDNPARAAATLGLILEMENISTSIGMRPHNLDPNKLTKNKFSVGSLVANIVVDDSFIQFDMLKNVNEAQVKTAATTLYKEIVAMLNPPRSGNPGDAKPPSKTKPRVKISKSDGRYSIKFTLNEMARESHISYDDIDFLKEHFPQLDDTKVRQMVKIINSD